MESNLLIRGYIDLRANSDHIPLPAPGHNIRAGHRNHAVDLAGQKAEEA